MNATKESNIKSIIMISLVSVLLFGIFYYLITDVSSEKITDQATGQSVVAQNFLSDSSQLAPEKEVKQDVKGSSAEKSVFKDLSTQKTSVQPKMVLGGTDQQTTQSTVPSTGSETAFGAFVVSSLVMFTGIYLLITQPKTAALAKFEKRIIRELD